MGPVFKDALLFSQKAIAKVFNIIQDAVMMLRVQPQPATGLLSSMASSLRGVVSADEAAKNLNASEVARQLVVLSLLDGAMCEVETTQFEIMSLLDLASPTEFEESQGRATKRRRVYEASAQQPKGCGCKKAGKCSSRCPCKTARVPCGKDAHMFVCLSVCVYVYVYV